jgi:hypothetical protein
MLGVLAACQGAPSLTDPKEIIAQGLDATADLKSFHVSVEVDGTVSIPGSTGTLRLEGTTVEADIDVDGRQVSLTFAVPSAFGLAGDVLITGQDMYVRTSATGTKWSHSELGGAIPGASAAASPDIQSMIDDVREFLAKDGVVTTKKDDIACGDRQCYHVQVSIPPELMTDADAATSSFDPSTLFGDALVLDLLFDREELWLTEIATSVDSETVGALNGTITFSAFDEAVTVSPPPSPDVTEGEFPIPGF